MHDGYRQERHLHSVLPFAYDRPGKGAELSDEDGARRPGQIIVLNGTSSAGKTSTARALQRLLSAPYLYVAFDTFMDMLPPLPSDPDDRDALLHETVSAMHAAIRVMAERGSNVIVDHILRCPSHPRSRDWIENLVTTLPPDRTFLVAVTCSLDELDRRERIRWEPKSGFMGLGRRQYDEIHCGNAYDAEVDTTGRTAEESARLVAEAIVGLRPHAIAHMQ